MMRSVIQKVINKVSEDIDNADSVTEIAFLFDQILAAADAISDLMEKWFFIKYIVMRGGAIDEDITNPNSR